ncbi:toxin-antitoxin system, toxin component [Streptomyces sp. ISL-86]|uniref:toxin-antitoxin system, toxin component n=1 Tax=Streptomyces sp. ISL-86 TaxID=2819187 RepID=UPI001BEC2088|nr:toxin-antitoxin system, toxin component [Streptomyces sp. ISL-86]MBT2458874.1 toxin-antitoxin system, toxin component [Streptomyces sp. ISL-86]
MWKVGSRRRQQQLEEEMARLCSELDSALGEPVPADMDELFRQIANHLAGVRGRPVRIVRRDFPPGLSGLWLDRQDEDVIVVVKSTSPFHALVILGHEIWHMIRGHCATHALGPQVATRLLDDLSPGQLDEAVRSVAARTHAVPGDEAEAEAFGRRFGSRLRRHVEHDPNQRILKGAGQRISSSLGGAGD